MEDVTITTVCISVENLYNMYGKDLYLNTIATEHSNSCTYYDLYNEHGELACLDGEEVNVVQKGNGLISFVNCNGEYDVYFALTLKEAEKAIIGYNTKVL